MPEALRILVLEDQASDFLLLQRQIVRQLPDTLCERVAGDQELDAALQQPWDVVLSDYNMPGLPFEAALAKVTERLPGVPVILVSGSIGEEQAVELLHGGVADFVLKDRHARLGTAIERALHEAAQERGRREAERALRESEERYRLLFEAAHDSVFLAHVPQGGPPARFAEVNELACRELGYTRDELLQISPTQISEKAQHASEAQEISALLAAGGGVYTDRLIAKDGHRFPVEISISPIQMGGQQMALAVARNVSERVKAEQERQELQRQLLQAQRLEAIGRLAGGVAHDFNNMLSVILGYGEAALARLRPDEPLHEDLLEIVAAARRSADLTRQLLAFSRKQAIEPKPIDLSQAISGMARLLKRLIGEDIELRLDSEQPLWPVFLDPSQVDQVVANLVVNSRDAMPGGGQLWIETHNVTVRAPRPGLQPGDYVTLEVRDTGCGINDAIRDNLFEPFFTTKAEGVGTGLGLATVYGIVQQNRGHIEVESAVGAGTTMRLFFARHHGDVRVASTPASSHSTAGKGEYILLVEDEAPVRKLAVTILKRLGYEVHEAGSPEAALDLVRNPDKRIDLLLTDLVMPGLNGRELADAIHLERAGLPVLFMSGYSAEIIADRQALAAGASFLQKPFSKDQLARHVRAALDG